MMDSDVLQWWCSAQGVAWDWRWQAYPGVWAFMVAFALAFWRLLRTTEAEPVTSRVLRDRVVAGIVGLLGLWLALDWPLGALGAGYLASAHMVQFLIIAMIAPPLLLYGMPEATYQRLPDGFVSALGAATQPLVALVTFNLIVITTHLPVVVDSLMATQLGSFVIDIAWLAGGLIFWWPVAAPVPQRAWFQELGKIGYLGVQVIAMKPLFVYLTFSEFPLYATYELAPRVHGISARGDQQAAGLLMETCGMIITLIAVGILIRRWSAREDREASLQPEARSPAR